MPASFISRRDDDGDGEGPGLRDGRRHGEPAGRQGRPRGPDLLLLFGRLPRDVRAGPGQVHELTQTDLAYDATAGAGNSTGTRKTMTIVASRSSAPSAIRMGRGLSRASRTRLPGSRATPKSPSTGKAPMTTLTAKAIHSS